MAYIAGFESDIKVTHIGTLFRNKNEQFWRIYVWFDPIQNIKATRLSNLPILSRGKFINSTVAVDTEPNKIVKIADEYELTKVPLKEFKDLSDVPSIRNKEGEQNAFRLNQKNAPTIYLPQLELARALFLFNSYMCRACLLTTSLSMDFEVRRGLAEDHAEIHVRIVDLFPLKAFDHSGTNTILSWVLTNEDARRSYTSICRNFNKEKMSSANQETWNFSFEPPPMAKWQFHLKGRYSLDKKSYLAEEIIGIDIHSDMPSSVEIVHPGFMRRDSTNGVISTPAAGRDRSQSEADFEIDDESASDQSEVIVIDADRSWVNFTKHCRVTKRMIPTDAKTIVPGGANASPGRRRRLSTGEPNSLGSLPAASVGGRQDNSEAELEFEYASRFSSFNAMLEILKYQHDCTIIRSQTLLLPTVNRSRVQLLPDGSPRVIKAVIVKRGELDCVLLEVDTSDGSKLMSTKLIFNLNPSKWERQFYDIRLGVVRHALSWPADLFDGLYGNSGHLSIPHPKHDGSEIGNIPVPALDGWARRIHRQLP